jgi:hypothetical protein
VKTSKVLVVAVASLVALSPAEAGWKSTAVVIGGGWLAKQMATGCVKSPQCRAKGVDFAMNGAIKIIETYGPVAVGKCAANAACMNTMMAAIAAGSVIVPSLSDVKPGPGEGMEPPGDCGPGELAKFTARVERYCKSERPKKCTLEDDRITIIQKVDALQQCLSARSQRETQCFRGGDRSHRTEIENTKNQMNTCFERLAKRQ